MLAPDTLFFDAAFGDIVFFAATRLETACFEVAGFDAIFFAAARFVADGVFAATLLLAVFTAPLVAAVLRVPEDFAAGFAFAVFLAVALLTVALRLLAGERIADAVDSDAEDLRSAALLRVVVADLRDTARFSGVVK